jgi:glycosyltransferase involved in cell wall biosynthesis
MQCRSTYTTGGGPDKTALLIAEKANSEKFNVILMYMRGADDTEFQIGNWARERGLTIHEVLERGKLNFSNLQEIHRLIKKYDIDVLHARDYKTAVVAYILSYFNPRLKLVFTAHLWIEDDLKMKIYTWLNILALHRFHRIIAVSGALRQFMLKRHVNPHKITVLHNAIDVETWDPAKVNSTVREEFNIPVTSKIVGVVGRVRDEKDIPTTLKVAKAVLTTRPDTYFLIVGDGPTKEESEQQAREMGLANNVLFLGFRKDTINVYAGLDVFASTSLTEGTPNTVLEAFAMGVPVIYTDVGGVAEIVQNGETGLLFQPGDVEGISQAVLSFLDDEEKAKTFGQRGREAACTKFSFQHRLRNVEKIYADVVGG